MIATINKGSFLTTNVWIPKEVWYQEGTTVPHQLEKIAVSKYASNVFDKISKLKQDAGAATV